MKHENPNQLQLTNQPGKITIERSELDDPGADNGYISYRQARLAGSVAASTATEVTPAPNSSESVVTTSKPANSPPDSDRKNGRRYVNRKNLGHRGKRIADGPPPHIKPSGRIGM